MSLALLLFVINISGMNNPPNPWVVYSGYALSEGYDYASTDYCIRRNKCEESNPLFHTRPRRITGKLLSFAVIPSVSYFGELKFSGIIRKGLKLIRYIFWIERTAAGTWNISLTWR